MKNTTKKNKVSQKMGHKSIKMGQLSTKDRHQNALLEFIYQNPQKEMSVREIATKIKVSRSTVQNQLKKLKIQKMVSPKNQWIDTRHNRLIKRQYYVSKISNSGIIEYLEKELVTSTIILFGSFAKGESIIESDIDLFVESARGKYLNLKKFERKLGHKIELFTKRKITQLPPRLLNNVLNGVKLQGYFTIT